MTCLKRYVLAKRAQEVFTSGGDIHDIISALEFHSVYDTALSLFGKVSDMQRLNPPVTDDPEDFLSAKERDYVWDRYNYDGSKV